MNIIVPKTLKSFKIEGRKNSVKGRNVINQFQFFLNSVESSFKNIGKEVTSGYIIGAGPGNGIKLDIDNCYFKDIWVVDSSIKDKKTSGESTLDITIKDSVISQYESVSSVTEDTLDVKYNINFKSINSEYLFLLNPGIRFLIRGGNGANLDAKAKVGDINIEIDNTEKNNINKLLSVINEGGSSFKNLDIDVDNINIKLNNININIKSPYILLVDSGHASMNVDIKNADVNMNNIILSELYSQHAIRTKGMNDVTTLENYKLNIDNSQIDYNYLMGVNYNRELPYDKIAFDVINPVDIKYNNSKLKIVDLGFYGENHKWFKNYPEFIYEEATIVQNNKIKAEFINSEITSKIGTGKNAKIDSDIEIILDNSKIKNLIAVPVTERLNYENLDELVYGFGEVTGNTDLIIKNKNLQNITNLYGIKNLSLENQLEILEEVDFMDNVMVSLLNPENWNIGDDVILLNPENINVNEDLFMQSWKDNPPYELKYIEPQGEEENKSKHIWYLDKKEKIDIKLDANEGIFKNNSDIENIEIDQNSQIDKSVLENPTRDGYKFIGWTTEKNGNNLFDFNKIIDKDMTLYAKWEKIDKPVEPEKPENGNSGGSNRPHKRPNKDKKDDEKEVVIRPQVNTGYPFDTINHMAYINGYEDGNFRPEKSITREEVSTILYRVLEENYRNSKKSN